MEVFEYSKEKITIIKGTHMKLLFSSNAALATLEKMGSSSIKVYTSQFSNTLLNLYQILRVKVWKMSLMNLLMAIYCAVFVTYSIITNQDLNLMFTVNVDLAENLSLAILVFATNAFTLLSLAYA